MIFQINERVEKIGDPSFFTGQNPVRQEFIRLSETQDAKCDFKNQCVIKGTLTALRLAPVNPQVEVNNRNDANECE
jgi:hypothetical protein